MTKKLVTTFFVSFLFVCLCGVVIGMASGIEWGTSDCGFLAGTTFWFAMTIGGVVAGIVAND